MKNYIKSEKNNSIYMLIIFLFCFIIIANALDIRPYYDSTKGGEIVYKTLKNNNIKKSIILKVDFK